MLPPERATDRFGHLLVEKNVEIVEYVRDLMYCVGVVVVVAEVQLVSLKIVIFLVPGVVSASMPSSFSVVAAYGDLAASLLALLALVSLRQRWKTVIPLVWTFNIVGALDLANALAAALSSFHWGSGVTCPAAIR